uniref:Uncharacterized protein n=1 Tax=Corethron hystrix TaxID=216773 RepID=A0A7S1C0E7_9STRA|mmetsp:Transcript_9236/g.20392  ORF Transcript_9236/g.20392 Transcript_9236/m.20392 type:complete len:138 (+) Transcript_9236:423-836(+)
MKQIKYINMTWLRYIWPRAFDENSATRARRFDHNVYKQRAMHTQAPHFSTLDLTCRSEETMHITSAGIRPHRRHSDPSRSSHLASIATAAIRAIDSNDPIEGEKVLRDMKNASSDNSLLASKLQEMILSAQNGYSQR